MHTIITIIAVLMISDACFTLVNLTKVESMLQSLFPSMNVKKLAMIEGVAGLVIIILKIGTNTIS
ncbi:MAG: hypothetical protein HN580_01120 [Deltaproteobacteria bacterium]|jgi:hypothetical protein|nr:hypothetical protein [Deltaproteobacteria bacterium]MBT4264722.1 hypothetical protein [Deltaproteobacteria bacterium]MBT4640429.1 hypothetical protein [Deltaproteobacteria bacterium]MBT6500603.1 hypothetical protein [Deltaproteobacteria bacterium]MBT6612082.1 hypothetical protein [Deltaproteobacteria bacterium]